MHNQPEYNTGFTLIELMVTIAIAGILVGIAIPSFTSLIISNRLTTSANELVTALNFARSEAIKRGQQVTVKRKGATTDLYQWERGWDVFVDSDSNNAFNDNGNATVCETGEDCLLRTYDALPSGFTFRTAAQNYTGYLPSGLSSRGFPETFRLCNGSDTSTSRSITLSTVGRARVSTGTTSCP
jgi:type IV fimbrial biogenesis protein FimT